MIDYSEALIEARKQLNLAENAIINKRDFGLAEVYAGNALTAVAFLGAACGLEVVKQRIKRVQAA